MVHFIGKDNIVFHCIIFPAMLKAEGSYILPENVPANEFLNLEGDKISTSRNWAVWLHEYLEEFKDKQDVLRYTLTANMPETKDNDFTWKDFQTRNNSELVAILGNFVNRTMVLTHKYFEGKMPVKNKLTEEDQAVLAQIPELKQNVEKNTENFRFREALKEAMNLARLGNKYLADTEPWQVFKTNPDRVKTILAISLDITAALTILMEPFLPFTCEKMRTFLNIGKLDWELLNGAEFLPEGHQLNQSGLLFEKIEDSQVEFQVNKLLKTRQENESIPEIEPVKSEISYEDFQKLDIRTGIILEAERVPKTAKLLKLLIDTGVDKRTVVSGIAEFYEPEKIIGQKVSILLNLAPRKIKGIESKGMILMAENREGKLCFVSPVEEFEGGAL